MKKRQITSYSGDTYEVVERGRSTVYHRVRRARPDIPVAKVESPIADFLTVKANPKEYEKLKADLAAALERVGELERDEAATRAYWSNAYYAMEAERDQLKRERQNVIEEAHRSALVNARNSAAVIEELRIEVEQLKRERDEYRDFLHPHTRDVLKKEQYRQGWENCREAVSDLLLLQPDRTHEECCDCALESVEPAQCAGHRAGPTECSSFVPVPERGKP